MELRREERLALMPYTLIGAVVHVDEQGLPVGRERIIVDRETMVLRSDEAAVCANPSHRLVMAAVTVLKFICTGSGCLGKKLIAHAYSAYRLARGHGLAYVHHRSLSHIRIARTVGYEQSVIRNGIEVIVPGHTHHPDTAARETPYYIMLDSTVHKHHGLFTFAMDLDILARHFAHKVLKIRVIEPAIIAPLHHYLSEH